MEDSQLPDVIPADKFVADTIKIPSDSAPDVITADKFVADKAQSLDESDPEAIADARNAKEQEINDRHGSLGQLGTLAEHAAASGTFGLSTKAETATGIATPEDIRRRSEDYPKTAIAGDILGLLNPITPEGKILGAAGKAGAEALDLGVRGSSALSKIGAGAIKGAIENAMFQGGDEVSKKFAEDPSQSAQTAITNIGLSGLLGAGVGTAFGAASPLFDAAKGNKFVDQMASRFKEHLTNSEIEKQPVQDLSSFHSDTNKGSDSLFKGNYDENGVRQSNVRDQAISNLVPPINDTISDKGVGDVINHFTDKLEEMKADPETYSPKFTKYLEKDFSEWQKIVDKPDVTSDEIFKATDDLKRTMQKRSKVGIPIDSTNPAFDSINSFKNSANYLKRGLENSEVWGEAGNFQKEINSAYHDFQSPLKDFNRSFGAKINNEYVVDPDKVGSYLSQASKEKGTIRGEKLQNYLDASDKYRQAINEAHEQIGVAGPFDKSAADSLASISTKLTPGARAADSIVKHIVEKGGGDVAGVVGGIIGGWPGSIVGKMIGGPIVDSVVSKMIKPILNTAADAAGFRTGLEYINAFAKGETALNKGIKNVFAAGKESTPTAVASKLDRDRLDRKLQDLQKDPSSMMNVGGKTSHYLPEHGQALSQTAMNAVNYLNSQRPVSTKVSPLDTASKPDPMAKQQFDRVLDVAETPLSILNHIKQGTLQPKDVQTIQTIYPQLYSKIASQIVSQISTIKNTDVIPYRTKMAMSLFLGQPMETTMTPQAITAAQPQDQLSQSTPQQSGKKPTAASAKAMNTVSQSAMTPGQARAAERSKVSV